MLLSVAVFAQNVYHVTRVSGKLTNLSTGKEVIAGDQLQASDQILFESIESYAITIGKELNRFQIKIHDPGAEADKQMLTSIVKDAARPTKMRSLMLARFDPTETEISNLRNYFGNDKFSVIGDGVEIPLSSQSYPLSENKFIVFFYRVENNPISKKIGHNNQTLILDRDKLTTSSVGTVVGNEIPDMAIYQYEASTRRSQEITRITLVFVDKNELQKEFSTIIPILRRQRMSDEDIKKYLIEYYYDFYGATDSKTIDRITEEIIKSF